MKVRYGVMILLILLMVPNARSQPSWEPVGPYGGYIRNLAKDANGNIYAATLLGGIFKSTNNGASWVQVYADTLKADFRSVAINSNGDIFGGTDGFGIQRSTNGGTTWVRLTGILFSSTVTSILILPNNDIIAARFGGVYRSTNNGNSFLGINTGLTNTSVHAVAANANGDLFAATNGGGVFRSTNGGGNWSPINTGIAVNDMAVFGLAVKSGTELWAAAAQKVYRSTNNGDNWSPLEPVPLAGYSSIAFASNGDVYAAASSINNAVGGGVFRSTDSGTSWTQESGLPNVPHFALLTSGTMIFAGTGGPGVYSTGTTTASSGAWVHRVNGMDNTHVYVLEEGTDSSLYAGTRFAGIFKSTDAGITWSSASNGLPYDWINAIVVNRVNGNLFAATNNSKYRSTDHGASWQQVHFVGATAMASNSHGHLFSGLGAGMYRSTDNGTSWSFMGLDPSPNRIADIACAGETVYVATGVGSGFGTSRGVFRSTDNGGTWAQFNNGLTNLNVTTVSVGDTMSPRIVCGTRGSGVFALDMTAGTWSTFNNGITDLNIVHVGHYPALVPLTIGPAISHTIVEKMLLVTVTTLYFYLAYRPNPWQEVLFRDYEIEPLLALNVTPTIIAREGGLSDIGLLATNGRGIARGVDFITSVRSLPELPERFMLSQNYPNPFNPSTTIKYQMPSTNHVTIKVFDILGREVATLVNEVKQPGSYEVTWDAAGYASGMYFYRLRAGGFMSTKKLVLLK